MPTATPLTFTHEHLLTHSGDRDLPAPWVTLASDADMSVQAVQNLTSNAVEVSTGTAISPLTLQPGDTLLACSTSGLRFVTRLPYDGFKVLTSKHVFAGLGLGTFIGSSEAGNLNVEVGDIIIAAGGLRGSCAGSGEGSRTIRINRTSDFPGLPTNETAAGIAGQPAGDENGNIGVGIGGKTTIGGPVLELTVTSSSIGPCGLAANNTGATLFLVAATEPLTFSLRARPLDRLRSALNPSTRLLADATDHRS